MVTSSPKKALIIDANSLLHRAWHALPPMTSPDGVVVNAVYGFTTILLKIVEQEHPSHLAVCWDTPEPTYRHTARVEYKAQREKQPDEFYAQIDLAKEIVDALGGTNVAVPGFEADDLLATFAESFSKKKISTLLLTSDRDVFQCINDFAHVVSFKKGVSETVVYDRETLRETMGLTPEQIPDYKAMRGDPSDNLKGIAGIGDKTATTLLQTYGSLDGIFVAVHDPDANMTDAVRKKLFEGETEARSLLPIVALEAHVSLPKGKQDIVRNPVNESMLKELFVRYGFLSLLTRVFGNEKKRESQQQKESAEIKSSAPPSSSTHFLNPSKEEVKLFFETIQKEKMLLIQPLDISQDSLFQDVPIVALGSKNVSLVLREKDLITTNGTLFAKILSDKNIEKGGHGLKRAWHWAKDHGFEMGGVSFDTEIASYVLSGGEGRQELSSVSASHLEQFFSDSAERPLEEVDAIRGLLNVLKDGLKTKGLDQVHDRFEIPLISILGSMENVGIKIDTSYFKTLSTRFKKTRARLEKEMEEMAGEPFNPASPQQLAHILFDVLEISPVGIKRGKTGISTAATELAKLEGQHPIVEKISEFREVAKLLSTYVDALPNLADRDGRVHTTYNQALTATGRLSSSNPNLQNIPIRTELGREIRRGFISKEGYSLLACDYSQIELRIVAALANDKIMLQAFRDKKDIHTATAAAILNIREEDVTREQRRSAKAINFGVVYGQGPHGLAKTAGISFGEAQEFIANYFTIYSGVYDYLQKTKGKARDLGYVETLFGRRRTMMDIHSSNRQVRTSAERMAINMPVQGTAADLLKLAMIEIAKQLPKVSSKTKMLLQVHDELVFEVPDNEVATVTPKIQNIMVHASDIGVPIVVDAKVGKNWDEMKGV
ncbi:MAG: DNA polymerase I [bacterium]|nr:DNA polymerase I [bacterium]